MAEPLPINTAPKSPDRGKESSRSRAAVLAASREMIKAGEEETAGMCEKPDPESMGIVKPGCELKIENKLSRAKFIESIRSTPAFEEMAKYVEQFIKDRKFKATYPASGSHIAPVVLAAKLIKDNAIDSAEMAFTEIDQISLAYFKNNLKYLSKTNPLFQVSEPIKRDDNETHIVLTYAGKLIQIKFTVGKDTQSQWFGDKDYSESTIVIGHDANPGGNEKIRSSGIILQYIEAARKNRRNIPILCEDTRPSRLNPKRQFDPEFFGKIVASGKEAYGCRGERDIFIRKKDGKSGSMEDFPPDERNTISLESIAVETGRAVTPSMILTLRKEVIEMDPFALRVLADISVGGAELPRSLSSISKASNRDDGDSTMHASANDKTQLFNILESNGYEHLSNIYAYSKYLLESFKKVDRNLMEGLALRILQNIIKCYDQIPKFIASTSAKNMNWGLSEFVKKIEMVESYLDGNKFTDIKKGIAVLKNQIMGMQNNIIIKHERKSISDKDLQSMSPSKRRIALSERESFAELKQEYVMEQDGNGLTRWNRECNERDSILVKMKKMADKLISSSK